MKPTRRVKVRKILADPKQKAALLAGATKFLCQLEGHAHEAAPVIKSCPFCGADGSLDDCIVRTTRTGRDILTWWVVCDGYASCGARGGEAKTKLGAIWIWNRRVAPGRKA